MGANFESKVIRKLCDIADIKKTRTTPYHPMGNGMVERFNKTLLNMMATLPEVKKTDWKARVSTLTHAYNAAVHDSTGFAPNYLMFGQHPRLAIDAFLGLPSNNPIAKSKQDYSDKLKEQLHMIRPAKKPNMLGLSTRSTMIRKFNMRYFNLEIAS